MVPMFGACTGLGKPRTTLDATYTFFFLFYEAQLRGNANFIKSTTCSDISSLDCRRFTSYEVGDPNR